MVCMQPRFIDKLSSHCQWMISITGEGMSHPQGSSNAVSCSPHIEIQDHARSDIMISRLDQDFNFAGSSENQRKACINDDAGSWNVEFKDGNDEYDSESCCSIDIDIQYLLGAVDNEQEQGFLLPSWQPELNESLLSGNTVDDFLSSETEATKLLELCTSDCWFGREAGCSTDAFIDEDWLGAEALYGDFLIDCSDEMEIPG